MQKTILQVPVNKNLRDSAEKVALSQGFSSLQEVVRLFLVKLADNRVEVTIQEFANLSDRSEKRYLKMTQDFKTGKDVYSAQDIDDLTAKLNAD